MADRIDNDSEGRLDDIAIEDVEMFRMERMTEQTFWIKIHKKTGDTDHVFWLGAELDENGYPVIVAHHDPEPRYSPDKRRAALDEMVAESQKLGLYDKPSKDK